MTEPGYRIAADIGGTFTDIAFVTDGGDVATRKVPSTPEDYSTAVVEGIKALMDEVAVPLDRLAEVLHGCTVATNAILERKGASTAVITTKGFRDVLELRRIRMPRLYDALYVKPEPLSPRRHRLEVEERIDARGEVVTPLSTDDVMRAVEHIRRNGIEAVAVVFLHSYANPAHEVMAGEILRRELPDCFVSTSVEILPEIREYERTSTTVINAYVGPPVRTYIRALSERLRVEGIAAPLLVMQSSGGMLEAGAVLDRPAQIVECGPAAGVVGAAYLARIGDYRNLITLDMGGTTAKASIIEDGQMIKTDEYEVGGGVSLSSRLVKGGGYALKTPVIDISEVGAGGGSVVWLDKAGHIKVGPRSAGAVPGPACYGTGGTEPTVTDANVVLGYLNPTALAGGTVPIESGRARAAIADKVADPLDRDLLETAFGIHTIANASMMRAVKAVSTYRGRDPPRLRHAGLRRQRRHARRRAGAGAADEAGRGAARRRRVQRAGPAVLGCRADPDQGLPSPDRRHRSGRNDQRVCRSGRSDPGPSRLPPRSRRLQPVLRSALCRPGLRAHRPDAGRSASPGRRHRAGRGLRGRARADLRSPLSW